MTRRSLLKRSLLSLALGAATTVAVAWGLAMWSPWGDPRIGSSWLAPKDSSIFSVMVQQATQPGAVFRSVSTEGEISRAPGPMPYSSRDYEQISGRDVDASWGLIRQALIQRERVHGNEEARGWPFVALYSWRNLASNTTGGTFLRLRGEDVWGDDSKVLPTLPIWRGCLLNTAFYAVLWMLPLAAPSFFIVHRRRRRGRCPKCGYDLRGQTNGCPECGHNRTPRATDSAGPPASSAPCDTLHP